MRIFVSIFYRSRFYRLCSQTRFLTKRKEIDVKSVYLNLGSDMELLVIFQKVSKVINKAFASLGTTIKLTNETTGRHKNLFFYFTNCQQKMKTF